MIIFSFSSASTILPCFLAIHDKFFFIVTLVCEPFQIPHGNGKITALEGVRPGLESIPPFINNMILSKTLLSSELWCSCL